MANNYTIKELKVMSTEQLIGSLALIAYSTTKAARQTEERIFRILAERNVIKYDSMKAEYERQGLW